MDTVIRDAFIRGFHKRAAEFHFRPDELPKGKLTEITNDWFRARGFSDRQLGKEAAVDGPYSLDQAAKVRSYDEDLKAMTKNRKEHFGHYLLNPFVRGPVHEIATRLLRRSAASHAGKGGWGWAAADMVSPVVSGFGAAAFGGHKLRNESRELTDKHLNKPKYFSE